MKRVMLLLGAGLLLVVVFGCRVPTGTIYEDQPIYLCDPEITIIYSGGGPTDGSNITFPVTVDTNLYSLYPGLLDTAQVQFDYKFSASVWNETTSTGLNDYQFADDLDDFRQYSVNDTTNASLTEVFEVDQTSVSAGDSLLVTVYATVTVRYNGWWDEETETYSFFESEQSYDLFAQIAHTAQ